MLGFAFKADTGDTRESAAISLIKDFQAEKAYVNIYDPKVDHAQIWADLAEASPLTPLDISKLMSVLQTVPEADGLSKSDNK